MVQQRKIQVAPALFMPGIAKIGTIKIRDSCPISQLGLDEIYICRQRSSSNASSRRQIGDHVVRHGVVLGCTGRSVSTTSRQRAHCRRQSRTMARTGSTPIVAGHARRAARHR